MGNCLSTFNMQFPTYNVITHCHVLCVVIVEYVNEITLEEKLRAAQGRETVSSSFLPEPKLLENSFEPCNPCKLARYITFDAKGVLEI